MRLYDKIKRILSETPRKDKSSMIEKMIENYIVKGNEDIICGVKVKHPEDRVKLYSGEPHKSYRVDIYFDSSLNNVGISDRKDKIMDDIWSLVYDYTGEALDMFTKYADCE